MTENNPRYPHFCRILRKTTDSPMVDEGGFTPIDDDYDPLGSDEQVSSGSESQASDEGSVQTIVVYEGPCRSYEKNTTSDRGDFITSYRGLSIPMMQEDWDKRGVIPMEGDEVAVTHGGTNTEYGRVIDRNVATAAFAGTHVIWRYGRG